MSFLGFHPGRIFWPDHHLERTFVRDWLERNRQDQGWIFKILRDQNDEFQRISKRDRQVAGTIIQWLGTPVGLGFIQNVLRQHGYELRPIEPYQEPEPVVTKLRPHKRIQ